MSSIGEINVSIPDNDIVDVAGSILNNEGPQEKKTVDIDIVSIN